MVKKDREYRNLTMAIGDADDDSMVVRGYASTFNEPYMLYSDDDVELWEVVDARAFDSADMSDVIMQYNHEGRVFARNRNNTLRLTVDERGLFIEADLGGTEIGRGLYEEIRGGYTDKMSFGFRVGSDDWKSERRGNKTVETRTITGVAKVYDVSAVSIPANDATSISVRSLADGVIERAQAERLAAQELELERTRIALRNKNELLKRG